MGEGAPTVRRTLGARGGATVLGRRDLASQRRASRCAAHELEPFGDRPRHAAAKPSEECAAETKTERERRHRVLRVKKCGG